MEFKIRREGGNTLSDVVIKLSEGLNMRNSMFLVDKYSKYERGIYLRNKDHKTVSPFRYSEDKCKEHDPLFTILKEDYQRYLESDYADAKSIMEVTFLAGVTGANIGILVEGTDSEAKEIASLIYTDLSHENPYNLKNYDAHIRRKNNEDELIGHD